MPHGAGSKKRNKQKRAAEKSPQCQLCVWKVTEGSDDGFSVSFCGHPDRPDEQRYPLPKRVDPECQLYLCMPTHKQYEGQR